MALGSGGGGGSARGVRAGAAYVELNAKDNLTAQLKGVMDRFMNFGRLVAGIGAAVATGGIALGIAGITAAAGPLVETITDLGKMQDVADAFGLTGRAASGLFGVLGAVGGEFKENLEGVIQFSGTMEKAFQNVGQGKELFDGLAVSAKELKGLGVDEQFYRVLGAIRQLPQPLQEAKLAMLGGTDSMKQWQKLLSMSEGDVRKLADKLSFSNSELRQAADASQAYQRATQSVQRAWQQIAVAVAPVVKEVAEWVEKAADGFTGLIKGRSAGNLFDEALVRLKIGLAEAFTEARNGLYGAFDYLTEGRNFGPLFQKFGEFFKGLVEFFSSSLMTAAEAVAKNLGLDPDEPRRAALRSAIAVEGAIGNDVSGYQRALDTLNDPAKARAMKERQLRDALAPDREAFDKMLGAFGGLAGEFDKEMAVLAERIEARKRQFAGIDADLLGPLNAELKRVQEQAEIQRNTALFREHLEDLMRPDFRAIPGAAEVGRAMGTFGGSADFIARSMGGGNIPKQQLAEQKKANQLAAESVKLLNDLVQRDGFVVT